MRHITRQMVEEAIDDLPNEFDSHDVENWMLTNHREAVALEIISHIRNDDMLLVFSLNFGKFIQREFAGHDGILREQVRRDSENLRGRRTECQRWVKIPPSKTA